MLKLLLELVNGPSSLLASVFALEVSIIPVLVLLPLIKAELVDVVHNVELAVNVRHYFRSRRLASHLVPANSQADIVFIVFFASNCGAGTGAVRSRHLLG
jgi:hypothetical protein